MFYFCLFKFCVCFLKEKRGMRGKNCVEIEKKVI